MRTTGRALLCAAALLVVPSAALRYRRPGRRKGLRHLHFETAPINVKPGQNSIDNVVVPKTEKPKVNQVVVRAKPDLEYLNRKVPPVDVIHLPMRDHR